MDGSTPITFMFTDIEASTRKWQLHGDSMEDVLVRHDRIVESAVERVSGIIVKHTGDGFMAVFSNGRALECALDIQRKMTSADWSGVDGLKVRIGLHTGTAIKKTGDYFGSPVNRAARLMAAGWGGQIVLSAETAGSEALPSGATLRDEGVHMLRDLLQPQQIFTLQSPDTEQPHPPLRTVSSRPNNLPVQPTPFVGRRTELGEIGRMLADPRRRMVTILGYGGAGKTRIALQAAAEAVEGFRHGAWFVPLEEAKGTSSMISAIADRLSLVFKGSSEELVQLREFIAEREMLLVLDNFEHLIPSGEVISRLLSGCRDLKVVVTSRAVLGIREESVYDLSGMKTPDGSGGPDELENWDSSVLFLSAARRVKPDFMPGELDSVSISNICGILQGLPLPIELAASWVRTVPCPQLEREIRKSLEILGSSAFDLPSRQRSPRAVFDYSWELLDQRGRISLAGLSVFEGGFTSQAAERVADCGLRTLRELCDSSLVRTVSAGRFTLHPLTRDYACERQSICAGGGEGLRKGHYLYYLHRILEIRPMLTDTRQPEALDEVALELPNIRKGALYAAENLEEDPLQDYVRVLSHYYQVRSRFSEAVECLDGLMNSLGSGLTRKSQGPGSGIPALTAHLKERKATFLMMSGRHSEAAVFLREAVDLSSVLDLPMFTALCLAGLGNIAYMTEDLDGAEDNWSRAISIVREHGLDRYLSSLLCNLANVRKSRGDLPGARKILEEVLGISSDSEDPYLRSSILSTLGDIALLEGDTVAAEGLFEESLEMSLGIGNLRGASFCLENLAGIALEGDPALALEKAGRSLELAQGSGAVTRQVRSRIMMARALSACGDDEAALAQLDAAEESLDGLYNRKLILRIEEIRRSVGGKGQSSS